MIQFLSFIFSGLFGFMSDVLPDSPFYDMFSVSLDLVKGIGYLNWFFPVGEALVLFTAYIALLCAIVSARMLWRRSSGIVGRIVGKVGGVLGL